MSDSKAKKIDYVVVRGAVGDVEQGGTIKLTEQTAKALVNKVVKKSEYSAPPKSVDTKELEKQIKKLTAERDAAVAEVEALKTAMGGEG